MTDFTYELHEDGIGVITWDVPAKSMNVLSRDAFSLIDDLVTAAIEDENASRLSTFMDFAGTSQVITPMPSSWSS